VKAASAAKVIVSGQFFGAGDALDAYLVAFLIPSFLADVFAAALVPAFIPAFIELREQEGAHSALALYGSILYRSIALFSLAALAIPACSHAILSLLASGFSPAKLELTRTLLGYMAVILPLTAVSAIWRSILNSNHRFAMAAIAPAMTPIVIIATLTAGARHFGVAALAAGTTLGAVAELAALFASLRRSNIPAFPGLRWSSEGVSRVFRQYCPIVVSSAVMGGSTILDQTMAAMLGSGSVSALNLGTRVSGVLLAVGPAALSTALFPDLSAMSARGEWRGLRATLRSYLLLGCALTVPVACALAWYSEPIARAVFERGAFVPRDTRLVAAVQAFSFLQLPLSVALALLFRTVASLRANALLMQVSIFALAANAALNYVLMQRMGVAGIALSSTGVHSLVLILAGAIVFRRLRLLVLSEDERTEYAAPARS
jgi:putative peptidoglycan lipid II flippase